jgi:hypothetical protein
MRQGLELKSVESEWEGKHHSEGLEHGSRGITIVGAITRQLLVKTLGRKRL